MISTLEDIPWTGTVILTKGDKVYINRGDREGVVVGQKFDVGEITVLKDPDTGEVLDQSIDSIGSIEVVKVKQKISICKVIKGGDIKRGMTVVMSKQ